MNNEYFHELDSLELIRYLENKLGIELTEEQKGELRQDNGDTQLYIILCDREKKSSLLWRLTLPFYFIFGILAIFVIQPIKWFITGDFYFGPRNFLCRLQEKWSRKIGI